MTKNLSSRLAATNNTACTNTGE